MNDKPPPKNNGKETGKLKTSEHKDRWKKTLQNSEFKSRLNLGADIEKIKSAVEPRLLPYVLKVLSDLDPSLFEHISDSTIAEVQTLETLKEEEEEVEERAEEVVKSKSSLGSDASQRTSGASSMKQSVTELPTTEIMPSPYLIELSVEEDEEYEVTTESIPSEFSEKVVHAFDDDLIVHRASTLSGPSPDILEDLRSPFQKFFSRSRKDIENHLNRHDKTHTPSETDQLLMDFISFLESPEIQLKSDNINFEALRSLFDIQLENPAAHGFSSDIVELPFIPKEIAEIYDDVESSCRASLHRQILWDMMYEKGKEKKFAFGSSIPNPRPHWNNNTKKKWLVSDEIPWDLVSGEDLWKDLLNTEILEGFAKWLLANPQYDRPKYLEKIGYFEGLRKDMAGEDPVSQSLKKKKCAEAFYALANNMKFFVGDNELSYLPRLEELKEVLQGSNQQPGERD